MNKGYVISYDEHGPMAILHLPCGMTSMNPPDVRQRYCGACHLFMDIFAFEDLQGIYPLLQDALRWPEDADGE